MKSHMERPQIYPDQVETEEEGHTLSLRVTNLATISTPCSAFGFHELPAAEEGHTLSLRVTNLTTISTPCSAFGFHELPAADNHYFPHPDGDQYYVSARHISASSSPSDRFSEDEHDDVRSLEDSIAFENLITGDYQVSDQTLSASPAAVPSAMDNDILLQIFGAEYPQWATEDRRSSETSLDSSYSYDQPALLQKGSGPSCHVAWTHPMVHRTQEIQSLGYSPTGGLVAIQNGETLTNASQSATLQGVREIVHASASSLPNLTNQDMKSSQMVWSLSSGKPVEEKSSRKIPPAQRAQSMAIRRAGGQCETCRNQKRKVCGPTNLTPVMLSRRLVFPGSSWKRTSPSLQAITSASGHSTQSFLRVDSFDFLDLVSVLRLVVPGYWTR